MYQACFSLWVYDAIIFECYTLLVMFFFSKYLGLCMWLPAFLAKPADPKQEYANL